MNKSGSFLELLVPLHHSILLWNSKVAHQKLDYVHNNPVEAGFVDNPEEWLYSSARDYEGRRGLLEINFLES